MITYGPVAGSGWSDVSAAGASAGTGAANSEASTFEKSACGSLRWMTIVFGRVVDDDAANPVAFRVPCVGSRADDVPEEGGAGRVELEVPLDGRLEIARLDRGAVRVANTVAQRKAVGPAVA